MALNHEAPLAGYDKSIGGSAGSGTHGGTTMSRPDGMPTRDHPDAVIVSTASGLESAIQTDNAIIYIDDDITFNSADAITIGDNVQLVGGFCDPEIPGRGPVIEFAASRNNINNSGDSNQNPVFKKSTGGPPTLWGISFRGPETEYFNPGEDPYGGYDYSTCGIWCYTNTGTFKAIGCEFWGWTFAGIALGSSDLETYAEVSRCSFHHNLMLGLGYGIEQFRGELSCDRSYFDSNRHGIASYGFPDTSYELTESVIGPNDWAGHAMDMHDYGPIHDGKSDDWKYGGDHLYISDSTFKMTSGVKDDPNKPQEAIKQRGVSKSGDEVTGCDFWHNSRPVEPGNHESAYRQVSPTGSWENFYPHDNAFDGPNPGYGAPRTVASGPPTGEFQTVQTDQSGRNEWHTVSLDNTYDNPVVLMKPMSFGGSDPGHIRVKNVQSDSFEFKIEEWEYLIPNHGTETVSFMVMEQGLYRTANNKRIEIGTVQTDNDPASVDFDANFPETPVVLSQSLTSNGNNPIVTRNGSVDATGFGVRIQEEEAKGEHTLETVGYIALEQGTVNLLNEQFEVRRTSEQFDHNWTNLTFETPRDGVPTFLADLQTFSGVDTCQLRYQSLTAEGVEIKLEEEKSADEDVGRLNPDAIGYVVSKSERSIYKPRGEFQTVQTDQSGRNEWHTVSLDNTYDNPVVLMKPMSFGGSDPGHIRVKNVQSDSFEFKIEEWNYLIPNHGTETVSFMVMEQGTYRTANDKRIEIGTVQADNDPAFVDFDANFPETPVVLSQSLTSNGNNPIVTRNNSVDATGFGVRVQEEEAKGEHTLETVGYIALEQGTVNLLNEQFEVRRTSEQFDFSWTRLTFETPRDGVPTFLADMQSYVGSDPCGLRYQSLTADGVDVQVEEEKSADDEVYHGNAEAIGYVVSKSERNIVVLTNN